MPKKKTKNQKGTLLSDLAKSDQEPLQQDASLKEAGETLRSLNTETLPVAAGSQLVGRTKDKNIDFTVAGHGHDPSTLQVKDNMCNEAIYCFEDQTVEDAEKLMITHHLTYLPVVDRQLRITGVMTLNSLKKQCLERSDDF